MDKRRKFYDSLECKGFSFSYVDHSHHSVKEVRFSVEEQLSNDWDGAEVGVSAGLLKIIGMVPCTILIPKPAAISSKQSFVKCSLYTTYRLWTCPDHKR